MKIRVYNIFYFFKLAFKGIFRNGVMTLASVVILVSSLLVMGSSWAITYNVTDNLNRLDGYNKILVLVKEDAEEYEVTEIGGRLRALRGVTSVDFKSKDDVLGDMASQYPKYEDLFRIYKGEANPLRDQYTVTYDDEASVNTLTYQIEQIEGVSYIGANVEIANNIDTLKRVITLVLSWLLLLLLVVSIFVISNTLKLSIFARRDEIAIMRYVGGTGFFVSAPFYIEGILIGAVSGGIAFGIQYYLYKYFMVELLGAYSIVQIIPFSAIAYTLLGLFMSVGVGAGLVSTVMSLRKYNKV